MMIRAAIGGGAFVVGLLLGNGCGGGAGMHGQATGGSAATDAGAATGGTAGGGTGGRSPGSGGTDAGTGGVPGSGTGGAGTGGAGTGGAGGGSAGGQGGRGTGGNAGSGAGGRGGAGGSVTCGGELTCAAGELCRQATWVPNNVDPNHVMPSTVTYSCEPNSCGDAPVACDCGRTACGMYISSCFALPLSRQLQCSFQAVCASPETRIATPAGERRIADLVPGDLVYSADHGAMRAVPILRAGRTAVSNHHVVELRTADGAVLEISAGHPTADGRLFGELRAGDTLDGVVILSARLIPYRYPFTYDILPASDSGTYIAAGRLIGSTLVAR